MLSMWLRDRGYFEGVDAPTSKQSLANTTTLTTMYNPRPTHGCGRSNLGQHSHSENVCKPIAQRRSCSPSSRDRRSRKRRQTKHRRPSSGSGAHQRPEQRHGAVACAACRESRRFDCEVSSSVRTSSRVLRREDGVLVEASDKSERLRLHNPARSAALLAISIAARTGPTGCGRASNQRRRHHGKM